MPVRVLHLLGVRRLVVSNAAGGLDPEHRVGDVMLIRDHLNLLGFVGVNPLSGRSGRAEEAAFGPRFFALNGAYGARWRRAFRAAARRVGLGAAVREGTYVMVGGPNFETPAELRMLRGCGADAVGENYYVKCRVARSWNHQSPIFVANKTQTRGN